MRKRGWDPNRPPPAHLLEPGIGFRIYLDEDVFLVHQTDTYRGRVYKFALTLLVVEAGEDRHVERVDSCDNEVHRHRFCRSGGDEQRVSICPIQPGDHMLITAEMERAYDNYLSTWEQRVNDWRSR